MPPLNCTVPPALLKLPVCVPSDCRLIVPVCAVTAPVLWKGTNVVDGAAPAVFLNVPELLNVAVPPNGFCTFVSLWQSHVPLLLTTLPVPNRNVPFPVHVVVAAVFRIRPPVMSFVNTPDRLRGPLIVVVPVPLSVPVDQLYVPFTVTVPVPVTVPPACVNTPDEATVLAPLIVSVFAAIDSVCVPDPPPSVSTPTVGLVSTVTVYVPASV